MRHRNAGRKFDRNTSSRRAMLRNLAANLILNERIETTDAKAKEPNVPENTLKQRFTRATGDLLESERVAATGERVWLSGTSGT